MNGPTTRVERAERLVYIGRTPDGRALYRPLTPGAEAILANTRTANVKPSAPVRAGAPGATRGGAPGWFWGGVLVLLAGALAGLLWVVFTVVMAIASVVAWVAANIALIIGGIIATLTALGVLFGRRVVIKQSNSVRL